MTGKLRAQIRSCSVRGSHRLVPLENKTQPWKGANSSNHLPSLRLPISGCGITPGVVHHAPVLESTVHRTRFANSIGVRRHREYPRQDSNRTDCSHRSGRGKCWVLRRPGESKLPPTTVWYSPLSWLSERFNSISTASAPSSAGMGPAKWKRKYQIEMPKTLENV